MGYHQKSVRNILPSGSRNEGEHSQGGEDESEAKMKTKDFNRQQATFFFWLSHMACGILVSQPGIEPWPPQ